MTVSCPELGELPVLQGQVLGKYVSMSTPEPGSKTLSSCALYSTTKLNIVPAGKGNMFKSPGLISQSKLWVNLELRGYKLLTGTWGISRGFFLPLLSDQLAPCPAELPLEMSRHPQDCLIIFCLLAGRPPLSCPHFCILPTASRDTFSGSQVHLVTDWANKSSLNLHRIQMRPQIQLFLSMKSFCVF